MRKFAEACERIASTTKKLEKAAIVADYLKSSPPEEASVAAVFLSGRPFPAWEETTLQVGGRLLWKVVEELSGKNDRELTAAYRKHGDLGSAAADLLEAGRIPLLISHAGEGATSDAQKTLCDGLRRHYPNVPFARMRVWMSFPAGLVAGSAGEDTTRGRSFLFFACGVFAGSGMDGTFTLKVPENGLIALNVPLDTLRLGSNSTRTTHPFYMRCWNDLAKIVGIPATIENPYWSKTKGEMIADCANLPLLTSLIPDSMSCSSPTKGRWQGQGIQHCGYCLPCIIRRAAIHRGIGTDATTYTLSDFNDHVLNTHEAEGLQVRSFQVAIRRLQTRPEIASALIHKSGPLTDLMDEEKRALAAVYSRGMNEVAAVLANAQTRPSS